MNYDNTHFYKIVCKDLDIKDMYIGHTTDFASRKSKHKQSCLNDNNKVKHNYLVYRFIRENGGWDNWDMILIETRRCENELDALRTERDFIERLGSTLNRSIPTRPAQERNKAYYEQNRNKILDYCKTYREEHKDKKNEYNRKYRIDNKETLNEKMKLRCVCDICGDSYTYRNKGLHIKKSPTHLTALKLLPP